MVYARIKTTFNEAGARKALAKQLQAQIAPRLAKLATVLEADIRSIVVDAIRTSAEWKSMHGGELQAILGLDTESVAGLDQLLDIWASQVVGIVRPAILKASGDIRGGVTMKAVEANFAKVCESDWGKYVSQPSNATIDFMRLLLLAGSETLPGFELLLSTFFADISRSAQGGGPPAIMREREGASFKIPAQWSGSRTKKDNFVTAAIASAATQIEQTIKRRFREIM